MGENISEKKRQGIYKNGEWDVKNLKFLADFMRLSGNTTTTLAQKVGIGRQAIYNYFKRDDMSIQMIHKIIESNGCKIKFVMERPEPTDSDVIIRLNNYFFRNLPEGVQFGKLYFVNLAMQRYMISAKDICEKLGCARSTVSAWFASDNMMISYVYDICTAFDLKLKIEITPKDE